MKLIALVCTLLAVAACQAQDNPSPTNFLDDLMKQALEVIRKHMIAQDPLPLPDGTTTLTAFNMDLTLKMRNAKISKSSNFIVNQMSNDQLFLYSKFHMTFPDIHFEGDFDVSGLVMGCNVSGPVTVKIDFADLVVNTSFHYGLKEDNSLFGLTTRVRYTYTDAKITETGLKVEGMSEDDVQFWFMDKLRYFGIYNIDTVTRMIINWILNGKTVSLVIFDLKNFIAEGGR